MDTAVCVSQSQDDQFENCVAVVQSPARRSRASDREFFFSVRFLGQKHDCVCVEAKFSMDRIFCRTAIYSKRNTVRTCTT
jgi:hypothetical protein